MSERNVSDLVLNFNPKTSVGQSMVVECKGKLMWKISGFSLCNLKNKERLRSADFGVSGIEKKFFLELYPGGEDENSKDFISVFLCSKTKEDIPVNLSISIVDINGKNNHVRSSFSNRNFEFPAWGWPKFCSKEKPFKEYSYLLPNDELTVSCVVTISDENREKTSFPSSCVVDSKNDSLIKPLSALRLNKELTDVVIINKEIEIPAHKVLLMARSSDFESLIKENGNDASILALDMDTEVLDELLNFIYTDKCHFKNVDFVLKLCSAAHQYAIPGLHAACTSYLIENMSEENVVDIAIIAVSEGEKELYSKYMDFICDEVCSVTFHPTWRQKLDSSPKILKEIIERVASKYKCK